VVNFSFQSMRIAAGRLLILDLPLVALAVFAGIVSARLLPIAPVLAAFFWLLRRLAGRRWSVRTPADVGILLLLLMLPITLWVTPLPTVTWEQVWRLLDGVALYYALANWASTPARLRWVVLGLALAGLGLALLAPFSVRWNLGKIHFIPTELYDRFTLLVSDTIHPNVMAACLVILLPIPIGVLVFAWQKLAQWWQFFYGFLAILMTGMLILTKARGAWLALVVVLMLVLLLRWRWGWLFLPAGALLVGAAIYHFGISAVLEEITRSDLLGGLAGRQDIWSRAVYMIRDFPFTGVGMGAFGPVADRLYPFFLYSPGQIPHAHDLFLQLAVDLGLPGLVAWLAIGITIVLSSWRVYLQGRAAGDGWRAGLGAGLLASQLAIWTQGLVDAVTWGMIRPAPLVWALWGRCAALAAGLVTAEAPAAVPASPLPVSPIPEVVS
jgi:putative inorganic carbon (HCO3(-)) transporter